MSEGIWSAVSGAKAALATLDAAANDVANASTPGYRGEHAVFKEVLARSRGRSPATRAAHRLHYARTDAVVTDSQTGSMQTTGRPLDVAIRGDGFFVVQTAAGERYTRDGALQIGRDGTLRTHGGDAVLDTARKPLRVAAGAASVSIGADGSVLENGAPVGRLTVVKFDNMTGLVREAASTFRATATSGPPRAADAALEPGTLEQSNVSPVKSMVDIVGAQRSFEASESAIQAFKDADSKALSMIRG